MKDRDLARKLLVDGRFNISYYYRLLGQLVDQRDDLILASHKLSYTAGDHRFLEIASKDFSNFPCAVLIRALIHGNESCTGLFLAARFNDVVDYAHERRCAVLIYPAGNPSGAAIGTRYNADGDRGSDGNNDWVRYKMPDGTWKSDLGGEDNSVGWRWASDRRLRGVHLPIETKLAHNLLRDHVRRKWFRDRTWAVIDFHEDHFTDDGDPDGPASYQYIFRPSPYYSEIIGDVQKIVPVWSNKQISAGQASAMRTDSFGSIVRYDGTLPDLTRLLGVKDSVTVEVSGETSWQKAIEVDAVWIRGLINLIT